MKKFKLKMPKVPNLLIDVSLINPTPEFLLYMRLNCIPWMCYGLEDGNYYDNRKVAIAIDIADEIFHYP